MSKNFVTGFDSLISGTTDNGKKNVESLKKHQSACDQAKYERVTIAIKSDNLQKIRIICVLKQLKLREVINDLITDFIQKNDRE